MYRKIELTATSIKGVEVKLIYSHYSFLQLVSPHFPWAIGDAVTSR